MFENVFLKLSLLHIRQSADSLFGNVTEFLSGLPASADEQVAAGPKIKFTCFGSAYKDLYLNSHPDSPVTS